MNFELFFRIYKLHEILTGKSILFVIYENDQNIDIHRSESVSRTTESTATPFQEPTPVIQQKDQFIFYKPSLAVFARHLPFVEPGNNSY